MLVCVRARSPTFGGFLARNENIVNLELETAAIQNAATRITNQNPSTTPEQAHALAIEILTAAGAIGAAPAPAPKPAGPPPMPKAPDASLKGDERARAWRQHERDLSAWLDTKQSYVEPTSDAAIAAKAELLELRNQCDAATDAEKVRRAMRREELWKIISANGMARL